jgi:hypothetical protein
MKNVKCIKEATEMIHMDRMLALHYMATMCDDRCAALPANGPGNGVPIQEISDTVGHKSTHVTETVYRHVIVPAIRGGATVMDDVFGDPDENE